MDGEQVDTCNGGRSVAAFWELPNGALVNLAAIRVFRISPIDQPNGYYALFADDTLVMEFSDQLAARDQLQRLAVDFSLGKLLS